MKHHVLGLIVCLLPIILGIMFWRFTQTPYQFAACLALTIIYVVLTVYLNDTSLKK